MKFLFLLFPWIAVFVFTGCENSLNSYTLSFYTRIYTPEYAAEFSFSEVFDRAGTLLTVRNPREETREAQHRMPPAQSGMMRLIAAAGGESIHTKNPSRATYFVDIKAVGLLDCNAVSCIHTGCLPPPVGLKRNTPRFAGIPAVCSAKDDNNNRRRTPAESSDAGKPGVVCPDNLPAAQNPIPRRDGGEDLTYYQRRS